MEITGFQQLRSEEPQTNVEILQAERDRLSLELLGKFRGSGAYDKLMEDITERMRRRSKEEIDGGFRASCLGHIFEEMALTYYYDNLKKNPEDRALAEFIHEILNNPSKREIDFFEAIGPVVLVDNKAHKTNPPLRVDLLSDSNHQPENNPDALIIDVVTEEETGKKVVRVIGFLDAKMGGKLSGKQNRGIEEALYKLIEQLSGVEAGEVESLYTKIIRGLDIGFVLPDEISIIDRGRLKKSVIRPQKMPNNDYTERVGYFSQSITVPVTSEEVEAEFDRMVEEAQRNLQHRQKG